MSKPFGETFLKAAPIWKDEREAKCIRLYKEHSSSLCDQWCHRDGMSNCQGSNSNGAHFAPPLVMLLEKRRCRCNSTSLNFILP